MRTGTWRHAKLTELKRLKSTANGNPMFEGVFVTPDGDGFTARTMPNAQFGYVIDNYRGTSRKWLFVEWRGGLRVAGAIPEGHQ